MKRLALGEQINAKSVEDPLYTHVPTCIQTGNLAGDQSKRSKCLAGDTIHTLIGNNRNLAHSPTSSVCDTKYGVPLKNF